jgi:hypothetical protein
MPMPAFWKAMLVVLVACLAASIVIGTVKLVTTPDHVFRAVEDGWRGLEVRR